ncbi:hypothetical protein PLEOSDRAFT_1091109 [Pleurotus ostreatus PC15]|uniref:Uncharacterized protein n=1 Tax=Pleurotus ostreatus (strain PC15) TaxID=1137138 RepID=A0A067NGR4_PLEO1|nr:hypothetical protein PLEOSDRAFT_1091109 [Pleurotus ostreatus PC15]
MPFAYDAILRSNALKDISVVSSAAAPSSHTQLDASSHTGVSPAGDIQQQTDTNEPPARNTLHRLARDELVKVNLGTWTAKEIQLCIMGSHGPENEYVSVGRIRLDTA